MLAARPGGPGLGTRIAALPRMISASLRRRYDGLTRLCLLGAVLAYLIWPLDLLPELLMGPIGLIDDAIVATWLAGAVLSETDRFLAWEAQRSTVVRRQHLDDRT